jgi:hypothetical protein
MINLPVAHRLFFEPGNVDWELELHAPRTFACTGTISRVDETPAPEIGKDDVAKARREKRRIVLRTEPNQLLNLGVRGGSASQFTCEQLDPDGSPFVPRGGAFVVAEVSQIGDFNISQFFPALSPEAFLCRLAFFQLSSR